MINESTIADLFLKYLENKCSAEEIKELLKYYDNPANEDVLKSLINGELGFPPEKNDELAETDHRLLRVKAILLQQIKERPVKSFTLQLFPYWLRVSAIWLIIFGSTSFIVHKYWSNITEKFYSPTIQVVTTLKGERKIIVLPDGSKVWLGPSSALKYPDQLKGNLREVKLEGEAFFEVAKDKMHPFIIHSGTMSTRVVGTSFDIQSYNTQPNSIVTVLTGIVAVTAPNVNGAIKSVTLKPNQRSEFNLKKGTLTSEEYPNAKLVLGRRDGILKYDGAPIADVVADISRYYAFPIVLESRSTDCLCYGEFNVNRPVEVVLRQIAAAISAKLIIEKGRYILRGGCEQ